MGIEKIGSYLTGEWRLGMGEGTPLMNPAHETVVATASSEGLDFGEALRFARTEGGTALRNLTFRERAALLKRMSSALHGHREALIESAIVNGGCTRGDAKFDIDGAILVLAHYAELGEELGDRRILLDGDGIQLGRSPRFWGQHVYVPRTGVAVLINAFNFPAWGFAEKAACALLAGVPVITKPATSTALTAYLATRVLVEHAELVPGAFGFIGGSPRDLFDHLESQDLVAFTGSAATGRTLRTHPKVVELSLPINVEADSLNAAVLGPDVKMDSDTMDLFLKEIAREMTQKTGQKCTAVRRVMVPEARVDEVISALGARLDDVTIGDPALKSVNMGPLTTPRQLTDVRAGVQTLREDADVVYGDPEAPVAAQGVESGKGCFFSPLILRAKDSHRAPNVHRLEVFGPVVTVLPYGGDANEASRLVQSGQGGLVASVYSDDLAFTEATMLGIAPFSGRIYLGSAKVVDHAMGSGLVLPQCVHGGPGRAGGGEELGGIRGVYHFMQRTVVQGARPVVERITGSRPVK